MIFFCKKKEEQNPQPGFIRKMKNSIAIYHYWKKGRITFFSEARDFGQPLVVVQPQGYLRVTVQPVVRSQLGENPH